jgi:hypothetical protein
LEAEQNLRQVVLGDNHQPVGFLQVGTDLAEKHVGRNADRAGEAFADLLAQSAFDLERELARNRHLALGAHQAAGHLIDRQNLLDRQAGIDRLQNAVVIVGIDLVPRLHRDDVPAKSPRIAHERAGLDAEGLGFVAGGDGDGRIRQRLHHDDRLALQGGIFLLLARREEGVEIEEQPLDCVVVR